MWDAVISYQRENGETISEARHFLVTDAKSNGAFVSDGFYRTGSSTMHDIYLSGNTITGDIIVHNALTYESDDGREDIVCRGSFTSNMYEGTCTIGSRVDFGWANFKLSMSKR